MEHFPDILSHIRDKQRKYDPKLQVGLFGEDGKAKANGGQTHRHVGAKRQIQKQYQSGDKAQHTKKTVQGRSPPGLGDGGFQISKYQGCRPARELAGKNLADRYIPTAIKP